MRLVVSNNRENWHTENPFHFPEGALEKFSVVFKRSVPHYVVGGVASENNVIKALKIIYLT